MLYLSAFYFNIHNTVGNYLPTHTSPPPTDSGRSWALFYKASPQTPLFFHKKTRCFQQIHHVFQQHESYNSNDGLAFKSHPDRFPLSNAMLPAAAIIAALSVHK